MSCLSKFETSNIPFNGHLASFTLGCVAGDRVPPKTEPHRSDPSPASTNPCVTAVPNPALDSRIASNAHQVVSTRCLRFRAHYQACYSALTVCMVRRRIASEKENGDSVCANVFGLWWSQ